VSDISGNDIKAEFYEDDRFDLIKFLLASAKSATSNDMAELAIHLYYSAFELSRAGASEPGDDVLEGMRSAWRIACSLPDRSTAEAIHSSLLPYNTPEQTESGVYELQKLAMEQLSSLGIPDEVLDKVTASITMLEEGGEDISRLAMESPILIPLDGTGDDFPKPSAPESGIPLQILSPSHPPYPGSGLGQSESSDRAKQAGRRGRGGDGDDDTFDYRSIKGYGRLIEGMERYGIVKSGDAEASGFMKALSKYHGIEAASAFRPLLLYGDSRDDVSQFAYATAGQLGHPVLHIKVLMNEDGTGSVRMHGPFRRSLFGPSDPTDIPLPCVLLFENMDMFMSLLNSAESENIYVTGPMGTQTQASMCDELLVYVGMIMEKDGICPLMTAADDVELDPEVYEIFGDYDSVEVEMPDLYERTDIWRQVYREHPSFSGVDMQSLIRLSEGVSRQDIRDIANRVVTEVYRNSMAKRQNVGVDMLDALMEMKEYFDVGTGSYQRIEDEIIKRFSDEISEDLGDIGTE
jgi:hypothetical protein